MRGGGWRGTLADKRGFLYGLNWLDPETGHWAPHQWGEFNAARVDRQLGRIAELGVDVVRVFLAAQFFQPTADAVSAQGLARLEEFLGIAERHGIRVMPTGPDHWEGRPAYWEPDPFTNPEALRALEVFWQTVGREYGQDPRIHSWDLLNEPTIGWRNPIMAALWPRWLREKYGSDAALRQAWRSVPDAVPASIADAQIPRDIPVPGSPLLWDYQQFRESIAEHWITLQLEALSAAGDRHPRTVGLIQWSIPLFVRGPKLSWYSGFDPGRVGRALDYVSPHFYPLIEGRLIPTRLEDWLTINRIYMEAILAYIVQADAGHPRPVVLGEVGWDGGPGAPAWYRTVAECAPRWVDGCLPWTYATPPAAGQNFGVFTMSGELSPWGEVYRDSRAVLEAGRAAHPDVPTVPSPFRPDPALVATDPRPHWLWEYAERQGLGTPPPDTPGA